MQTDSIGYKDDVNLYAYVGGNPISAVDPDGRSGVSADLCIVQCVGASVGFNFFSGELAINVSQGVGFGTGAAVDFRLGKNGSPGATNTSREHGVVAGAAAKLALEIKTPIVGYSHGYKTFVGKDGDKPIAGGGDEPGWTAGGAQFKVGIGGAVTSDVSMYVNVYDAAGTVLKKAFSPVTEAMGKLEQAVRDHLRSQVNNQYDDPYF